MAEITLRNLALFRQMSDQSLAEVEASLVEKKLAAGEILFNQGDPGTELIIVKEGKVAIYTPLPGAPASGQAIRLFTPGDIFGEMALIDQQPRSTSARAEEPTTLLTLSQQAFSQILSQNPEMNMSLMAGLNDRIRYTTDFLSEVREWVQRITEGNYHQGVNPKTSHTYSDPMLATLAAEFAQMAASVKQREDILKQQVNMLKIEIDEVKRREESSQIMNTEYYQNLKEKVRSMRQKKE